MARLTVDRDPVAATAEIFSALHAYGVGVLRADPLMHPGGEAGGLVGELPRDTARVQIGINGGGGRSEVDALEVDALRQPERVDGLRDLIEPFGIDQQDAGGAEQCGLDGFGPSLVLGQDVDELAQERQVLRADSRGSGDRHP